MPKDKKLGGVLCLLILLLISSSASAMIVTLTWIPPTTNTDGSTLTDLAGYKIYWGLVSGVYTSSLDVGNVTVYQMNLPDGCNNFAVTAYNSSNVESDKSNIVARCVLGAGFTLTGGGMQ